MSSLESQENKQLLWGILAEEGIFDTVPESVSTEEVKHIFERIIRNLSASIPALIATRLKELYIAKERAIAEEDYDAAKTIRASIEQIEAPSTRILKLEQRKQTAIQAEDYDSAKQIKSEIDRIRMASISLTELNKIAIQTLATGIPKITAEINAIKGGGGTNRNDMFTGPGTGTGPGPMPHFPSSQEMYNAEDFQSQKRKDIELKMREKENEMRSFLEAPRPAEIDFSDRQHQPPLRLKSAAPAPASASTPASAVELVHLDYNGAAAPASASLSRSLSASASASDSGPGPGPGSDSPIGDDMDKLIAERIASRERDLEEITQQIKRSAAPTASNQPSNDIMIMRKPAQAPAPAPALEHKVRFDEHPDIIQDSEPPTDINTIFMKLKRKPDGGEGR